MRFGLPRWAGGRGAPRRISLALQGGGAHGAFTWGVLDALIQEPRLEFEGLSGSSAGAMNAVVLADGWMKGGRDGARQGLADFWSAVGRQMPPGMVAPGNGDTLRLTPPAEWLVRWAAHFSPAQLNPFDLNPLRDVLAAQIDFPGLRAHSPFKLFVGATQANTAKLRVFRETELTLEMLLASACLPKLHHPVEIDGEPYWDGGYSANPAVFPLVFGCDSADVLLVLLAPLRHQATPRSLEAIETRIVELSFSATFMREMGMFARAAATPGTIWSRPGKLERRLKTARFHRVDTGDPSSLQSPQTRLLAHAPFLRLLCEQGQARGAAWVGEHLDAVGRRGTLDLAEWFG